jgi:hypothetical protein
MGEITKEDFNRIHEEEKYLDCIQYFVKASSLSEVKR